MPSFGKTPALLVPRNLETFPRVFMGAAGPPPASPPLVTLLRARRMLVVRGRPEPPAREPLHHDVWMFRLQLLQRRQQVFLGVRPERRWLSFEDDRPVSVTWRHRINSVSAAPREVRDALASQSTLSA